MKALIAFIVMAVVILALIEINERIKKRRNTGEPTSPDPKDCSTETACTDCSLLDICDKEEKKTARKQ